MYIKDKLAKLLRPNMKNFILIGSSGYVAKKHLNAIKNKNKLLAAMTLKEDDLLNSFFPKSNFFSNLNSLQNLSLHQRQNTLFSDLFTKPFTL